MSGASQEALAPIPVSDPGSEETPRGKPWALLRRRGGVGAGREGLGKERNARSTGEIARKVEKEGLKDVSNEEGGTRVRQLVRARESIHIGRSFLNYYELHTVH